MYIYRKVGRDKKKTRGKLKRGLICIFYVLVHKLANVANGKEKSTHLKKVETIKRVEICQAPTLTKKPRNLMKMTTLSWT